MRTETEQLNGAQPVTDETRELLAAMAAHPFLKGVSNQHMQVLAASAMLTTFKKGELIFREGDVANRFYLIQKGKVALECPEKDHEPLLIQEIGSGDVLGWSWLFPPYYWHFDARAVADTSAIFFYGTRLREQCDEDPCLGYELMRRMSETIIHRLQSTRKQLLDLRRQRR